jgi:hypothetical protein
MGLRGTSIAIGAGLLAVGLLAASPFFHRGLVGTGEAYNYSLSVADAVTQMRGGEVPPLVGQTEYAFNGRTHPLRNAPYLYYLAGAIDLATLHRLSFWELQNASLALSLVAAVFSCYWGLRRGIGSPRPAAFFLAGAYGLSAPLLSAAHEGNLFMTVHAAVFVPLAVAACLSGCRRPSFSTDARLAAALAATWLAHPPVALWLTASVLLVRALAFIRRPSWRVVASGLAALLLGLALAGFVFASAATLSSGQGVIAELGASLRSFTDVIMTNIRGAFPGALLPVSRSAGELADLQFGYVPWALLLLTCALLFRRPQSPGDPGQGDRFEAGAAALAAVVLLAFVLPVPLLTRSLWRLLPGTVLEMTSEWPMQRLYLVAAAFTVFGAGAILPGRWRDLGWPRWSAPAAVAAGSLWALYQAEPFIARGFLNRWTPAATLAAYKPSNVDLTITSYAFLGLPPTFNYGVVDPRFEFRILRDGSDELGSNLAKAQATAPVVGRGELRTTADPAARRRAVSGRLTLAPGHRYLLSFTFKVPPVRGFLEITGPLLRRIYTLPSAGKEAGFGMLDGQRRAVPLWTDLGRPETVEIGFDQPEGAPVLGPSAVFAEYTLLDVDMGALPVRLESLLPLRFAADAPEIGCTVETPRRFIEGYEATVNGVRVTPIPSPYGQLMVPVPKGRSEVEVRYPGPPLARAAFWLGAASWVAFVFWRSTGLGSLAGPRAVLARNAAGLGSLVKRHRALSAGTLLAAAAAAALAVGYARRQAYLRGVGPIRIEFELPYGKEGVNLPLLSTGRSGAGVVVFATPIDAGHIRMGADVWGNLYQSGPIEVDPFRVQALVVSDSALFPADHPEVRALDDELRERLRGELRVELNGRIAIEEKAYGFESRLSEIRVGEARIGSLTGPRFIGRIDGAERLPIPQEVYLPKGRRALVRVRFPEGRAGASEPLVTVKNDAESLTLYASYLADGAVRIASIGSDGKLVQSGELRPDPARGHDLEVVPDGAPSRFRHFAVACLLDGARVLGPEKPLAPYAPSLVRSGLNGFSAPGVDARFTGRALDLSTLEASGGLVLVPWGPLHLVLTFPQGKSGRHEPLLTTGKTGRGDFIYVVYKDDTHVRIGFDHWGSSGAQSKPVAVDYRTPHELLIRTGALYPEVSDNVAWGNLRPSQRSQLRSGVSVVFDDVPVLESEMTAYPSAQADVAVGRNPIGGSSADPEFSGVLQLVERTGLFVQPKQDL